MVRAWRRRRRKARRARQGSLERREEEVVQRTRDLVRRIAGPLEESGAARIEWGGPASSDLAEGINLVPSRQEAASVALDAAPDWITFSPGLGSFEIWIDQEGQWEDELTTCLRAVIDGHYREKRSRHWYGRKVRMIFTSPSGKESTATYVATPADVVDQIPLGDRAYAPYEGPP